MNVIAKILSIHSYKSSKTDSFIHAQPLDSSHSIVNSFHSCVPFLRSMPEAAH